MDHDRGKAVAAERARVRQRRGADADEPVDGRQVTPLDAGLDRGQRLARLTAAEIVDEGDDRSAARPAEPVPVRAEDRGMDQLVLNDRVVDRGPGRPRRSQGVAEDEALRDGAEVAVPAQAEDVDFVAERSKGTDQRAVVDEAARDLV